MAPVVVLWARGIWLGIGAVPRPKACFADVPRRHMIDHSHFSSPSPSFLFNVPKEGDMPLNVPATAPADDFCQQSALEGGSPDDHSLLRHWRRWLAEPSTGTEIGRTWVDCGVLWFSADRSHLDWRPGLTAKPAPPQGHPDG